MIVGDLVEWANGYPVDLLRHPVKARLCVVVESCAIDNAAHPVKVRSVLTGQLFATLGCHLKVISESRKIS